jgi:hypothetical protein
MAGTPAGLPAETMSDDLGNALGFGFVAFQPKIIFGQSLSPIHPSSIKELSHNCVVEATQLSVTLRWEVGFG